MPDTLLQATLATPESVREVEFCADQYQPGEPGHTDPKDLVWVEVVNYPISRLRDAATVDWFAAEQKMWADEGDPERFEDLLTEPIHTPVVVYDDGDGGWTWDGNHRIGATLTKGETTIAATVGLPLETFNALACGEPHSLFKLMPEPDKMTHAQKAIDWLDAQTPKAAPRA